MVRAAKNDTKATVASNLRFLLDQRGWSEARLAKASGVAQKTINNILRAESGPRVDTVDALAQAFGIRGWHLLIPNLPHELATSKALSELVEHWASATDEGRSLIQQIADREHGRDSAA